jgi:hypothetical protein
MLLERAGPRRPVWPPTGRNGHHAMVTTGPREARGGDPGRDDGSAGADPVLVRRRRMARAAELGQRVGYALFGLAVVVFVVGFAAGLTPGLVTAIVVALGAGSLLLAPAIVVGYAVKAADRDDRERGSGGSVTRRSGRGT